jgi:uncharacterized protein with beta-barrel porin domain
MRGTSTTFFNTFKTIVAGTVLNAAHAAERLWQRRVRLALAFAAFAAVPLAIIGPASAQPAPYGPPFSFAVLAGTTITNTGPSVISGDIGVSPGVAVVGFPPGTVLGTIHAANAVSAQGQADLTTAYNTLAGLPAGSVVAGNIGGQTLFAGTYTAAAAIGITGDLILDGQGNPNAVFVFQIGSTLTTASGSRILLVNGANAANVYFQVGSSATLGTNSVFKGRILALTSITLTTGASIDCGAALARNGAVTLDTNIISICLASATVTVDALGGGGSANAVAVAQAIDAYRANGGTVPLSFDTLSTLSAAALALALEQLAGEAATSVAPAASQAMDSFLTTMMNGRRGPGVLSASGNDDDTQTVSVMGYAPVPAQRRYAALDAFDNPALAPKDWSVWIGGYGGYSLTLGNAAIGSHDRTVRDFGVAAGFERQLDLYTMLGLSIAKGRTTFGLANGFGGGASDTIHAALYGRAEVDNSYVTGALAYGYHDVSTERTLTFAGIDRFAARFGAHNVAGEIEVGRTFGIFTPYGSVRGQAFMTPAYSETTIAGSPIFALSYDGQTVLTARAELGIRADWTADFEGGYFTLSSGIGLARDFGSNTSKQASFQALPGSSFTVQGAAADQTSVLLSAGLEVGLDNGFSLGGNATGSLSQNTRAYSGSARLGYRW